VDSAYQFRRAALAELEFHNKTMIDTNEFFKHLKNLGYSMFPGVPCSYLKGIINCAIQGNEYVMAANEGDAIAIACGVFLGGGKPSVLLQNSGLTNASSPLTSLSNILEIPILGFIGFRSTRHSKDEPQHELMGNITTDMLDLMNVQWEFISNDTDEAKKQLSKAQDFLKNNKSFFFLVENNIFSNVSFNSYFETPRIRDLKIFRTTQADALPSRYAALEKINGLKDANSILIAATGMTGRELYDIEDYPGNLYMVGSMGCASSIGLGLALTQPRKNIIIIDGDGALLMRLGSMATNSFYSPKNMLHILLDNNSHDSTGGQPTVSNNVDFIGVASSVGYPVSVCAHDLDELEDFIKKWKNDNGLTFLYLKIAKGSKKNLGRPTIMPCEIKERLMNYIKKDFA
jgi:phosphonopyruvate decarboxylase